MSSAQRFLPQCWPHRADFIGSIPFGVALPSSSPCAAPSPGYAESRAAPVQSPALLSGPTGHPHHRQRLESVDLQYSKGECQISVYMHVRTHSSVLQGRSGCSCDSCFILLRFLAWCKAASCLVSCTQLCPGAVRGAAGGHLCWLYRCSSALLQDSTLLPLGQLQGCVLPMEQSEEPSAVLCASGHVSCCHLPAPGWGEPLQGPTVQCWGCSALLQLGSSTGNAAV